MTRAALACAAFLVACGSYVALAFGIGPGGVVPGALLGVTLAIAGVCGWLWRGNKLQLEGVTRAATTSAALLAVAAALVALGGLAAVVGPLVALAAFVAGWFALD